MNGDQIPGPYVFGNTPPHHLMGWRPEAVPTETRMLAEGHSDYPYDVQPAPKVPAPIWTHTLKINSGKHLPTFRQETGDCVAAGLAQTGARLQVAEIATLYEEERLKLWHVPYIYGISRVQVGGGSIPGPGSTGTWGAAAVREYGVLFTDDPNAPAYNGGLSDRWGEVPGPPQEFQDLAHDNPVKTTAKLQTIDQVKHALCNYYPLTIASYQGFDMQPREHQGYHVWVPSGYWSHQMCLIAWMSDPFPAAYRLNSWGADAHGTPLNGEPPGGAWCHAEDIAKEMTDRNVEVYAYSHFEGFPSAADRGLL